MSRIADIIFIASTSDERHVESLAFWMSTADAIDPSSDRPSASGREGSALSEGQLAGPARQAGALLPLSGALGHELWGGHKNLASTVWGAITTDLSWDAFLEQVRSTDWACPEEVQLLMKERWGQLLPSLHVCRRPTSQCCTGAGGGWLRSEMVSCWANGRHRFRPSPTTVVRSGCSSRPLTPWMSRPSSGWGLHGVGLPSVVPGGSTMATWTSKALAISWRLLIRRGYDDFRLRRGPRIDDSGPCCRLVHPETLEPVRKSSGGAEIVPVENRLTRGVP